jgi:hypothetical protein
MLPLARYRAPGDPLLLCPGGEITAALFFAQARKLAMALPGRRSVINLCQTRHGYLLGFAAALMREQTSLLPSGQGRGDWEQLLRRFPDAYLLSDAPPETALDAGRFFDVSPFVGSSDANCESRAMQIPQIGEGQCAAILFTSGSTGQPAAHPKTWGQLCSGAESLVAALNWGESPACAVVGSVPPQHMFGLETTVILPWYAGIPVYAQTPLLPADLDIALRKCARPSWWMTTPVHLRTHLRTPSPLHGLEGIVASTMSLPASLANAAEAAWRAPVMEIYGSTETGALATRRTAIENAWIPLTGVSLWQETGSGEGGLAEGETRPTWATSPHIGPCVKLGDELKLLPDGSFLLLGRSADLIKVGGKRASLSALNRHLIEIPGIEDAVFFLPQGAEPDAPRDDSLPARRLIAFYVSPILLPQEVVNSLRARVDPVFIPRPLYRVAQLPRNVNGKLPRAELENLFAQCRLGKNSSHRSSAGNGIQHMTVPAAHPALPGHFPHDPIVPGVIILTRVADAICGHFPHIELGELLSTRFHAPLGPDEFFCVLPQLRGDHVHFEVRLAASQSESGAVIASGQWACRSPMSARAET